MLSRILCAGLALAFVPLMQGCDDREVATGAAIGAVIGGTVAAINDDGDRHRRTRYHRTRYDNYYRHRRNYYDRTYRNRYHDRSYYGVSRGYYQRRNRIGVGLRIGSYATMESLSQLASSRDAQTFTSYFEVPSEVAAILTDVKNRAAQGDLSGLNAIGIGKEHYNALAYNQALPLPAVHKMARNLGIDPDHAKDIIADFGNEFRAQVNAGRIKL